MGTIQDHRKCAEACVARARLANDDGDKALWLTLAQSWVRLADHVRLAEHLAGSASSPRRGTDADEGVLESPAAERG